MPSIKKEEYGYTFNSRIRSPKPCVIDRSLIVQPRVIRDISTESTGYLGEIYSVCYLGGDMIWTCGIDNTMRLFNLDGILVKSIETKSGNRLQNIAVTNSGDLVYLDFPDKTVNIVMETQVDEIIRLNEWMPLDVCSTFSCDLLVIMVNGNYNETKVVRYCDHIEKQNIQYDDKGHPLYLSSGMNNIKYICENRNLYICVADLNARALVVVNHAGKHRFTYKGGSHQKRFKLPRPFTTYGLTTDSQSRILIADYWNNRIDIIDQDGLFIRCIDNLYIRNPCALCVDRRHNLFVVESGGNHVKKNKILQVNHNSIRMCMYICNTKVPNSRVLHMSSFSAILHIKEQ